MCMKFSIILISLRVSRKIIFMKKTRITLFHRRRRIAEQKILLHTLYTLCRYGCDSCSIIPFKFCFSSSGKLFLQTEWKERKIQMENFSVKQQNISIWGVVLVGVTIVYGRLAMMFFK